MSITARIATMAADQSASIAWHQENNSMNQNHTEMGYAYLAKTAFQIKKNKAQHALLKTQHNGLLDPISKNKLTAIYTQQIAGYKEAIEIIDNQHQENITATLSIEVANPTHL